MVYHHPNHPSSFQDQNLALDGRQLGFGAIGDQRKKSTSDLTLSSSVSPERVLPRITRLIGHHLCRATRRPSRTSFVPSL